MRTVPTRTIIPPSVRCTLAIEIGLVRGLIRKIASAFNHKRSRWRTLALWNRGYIAASPTRISTSPTHLRALLFQNRLARQPDAVAFHRQHFHQHLVAFLQLIADIADAMLRHFTDVQQPIGTRQNFDKRSKVRQPRDFPEIRLPYFRRRRNVSDNLQGLRRRRLIARRHLDQPGVFHVDMPLLVVAEWMAERVSDSDRVEEGWDIIAPEVC